jgi:magnesium-transporting ATPase (P-type)
MRLNAATVTGESLPTARNAAPSDEPDLLAARNLLLAGTSVISGNGKALVFATGMHTEFGKIAHLTQSDGEVVSPLRQEVAYLSRVIVTFAVLIGLIFFAIGQAIGITFWQDFIFAIGIIVAMVPEGLLPTLTLALVLAAQRMAKRHVLIRHLSSVETLGSTTVICTDKTGTLTQNCMTVRRLFLGESLDMAAVRTQRQQLADRYGPFFFTARLCHDLKPGEQQGKVVLRGDPMEIALVDLAAQAIGDIPAPHRMDEIPFDADRMRLSTVYAMPEGPTLYCKGAPESVVPLCTQILLKGETHAFGHQLRERVLVAQEAMAAQGLRVLALAHRVRKCPRPS